jgi:hypothetical protein
MCLIDKPQVKDGFTRRKLLQLASAGATALGATLVLPEWTSAAENAAQSPDAQPKAAANLYSELLHAWCDGLVARQITAMREPALYGGLLCPACGLIHGRCGDAVYPLLRMARTTGDSKYIRAAILVHDWSDAQVTRPDGSWVNDINLSLWKGITVFHSVALAEALHHHGELLDAATRQRWTDRLARAAKFLDGFMTIETGNINYPVTSSYCFAICGQVLGDSHYLDRARQMAHTALEYFTPAGFLFGEGHPLKLVTAKKCHPVDLGYNVEESLPSLALYALLTNDKPVLDQVIAALRTHMEFMLPDGAWDNSWGSRNYKWSWWGSRTSDGCHPAFVLLAKHDLRFAEVAWRNLGLMAACTHDGLLYGGPHYHAHGDLPCIHHTFTHAKALATALDRGDVKAQPLEINTLGPLPNVLPRDEAYGLRSFQDIGTHLAAIGEWRATVTENDFDYIEHVQAGGGSTGGHVSGGALSLLFHRALGPILTASMTQYQTIEISNQQVHHDYPHMELTPRIECSAGERTYVSVCDFAAVLTANATPEQISFDARGRLLTASHQPVSGGDVHYHLAYRLTGSAVEITASADASGPGQLQFMLPVVSQHEETVERVDAKTVRITKPKGKLVVRTDAPQGFEALPKERTFNLVPGFECVPLAVNLTPGADIRITLSVESPVTKA